jgi:hypothetical protein
MKMGLCCFGSGLRYIVIHNIVVTRNIFEYPNNVDWKTPDSIIDFPSHTPFDNLIKGE